MSVKNASQLHIIETRISDISEANNNSKFYGVRQRMMRSKMHSHLTSEFNKEFGSMALEIEMDRDLGLLK